VLLAGQDHLLGLDGLARRGELVAELPGLLVLLAPRGAMHLRLEPLQYRRVVSREEVGERVHVRAVPLVGDAGELRNARPAAPPDVVVETRPFGARPLVEEG